MAEFKACTSRRGQPATNKRPIKAASLQAAVRESDWEFLWALRDKLAAELDYGASARDMAALVKQLREVNKEIRDLEEAQAGGGGGKADEYWHAEAV